MRRMDYEGALPRIVASPECGGFSGQVLVPCCQALLAAVGVGSLFALLAWGIVGLTSRGDILGFGAFFGALAFVGVFFALLLDSRGLLRMEVYQVGGLEPEPRERLIMLNADTPQRVQDRQAQERRSRFEQFVRDCQMGTDTRRLETLGYSRQEVEQFRDVLIRTHAAKWRSRDPRRGWELAGPVDAILGRLL